jgi:DNA-binding PucR family transcriptional regulator
LNNSEEELIDFVYEVLGPLINYEKKHAKEFLHTLYVYLSHNQKMKETAEAFHIHLNTLAYRLKRIEEIIGIDLSQSRHALDVFLAVSLYELLEAKIK